MANVPRTLDALRGRYEGLGFKFGTFGPMVLVPAGFAALAPGMAEAPPGEAPTTPHQVCREVRATNNAFSAISSLTAIA